MSLSQQKFREIVFQLLFSEEMNDPNPENMTQLMMAELAVSKKNVKMAQEKMHKVLQKLPEIDPLIMSVSIGYEFNRIQTLTKTVLRLGVFELLFDESIPPKVAITEAMRLARKFGTPESATFVNAVLDHLYQASQGLPQNIKELEAQAKTFDQCEKEAQAIALKATEAQEKDNIGLHKADEITD